MSYPNSSGFSDDRPALAIACLVWGVAIFTLQDAVIKLTSGSYPVHQVLVIRGIISVPILLVIIAFQKGLPALWRSWTPLLLLRGAVMFSAYTSYFLGLAELPIATCLALYFVAPMFVTVLSSYFLGERPGIARWIATGVGLCGAVVVLRPGTELFHPAAFLPLYAGLAYAVSAVLTRRIGMESHAAVMAVYSHVVYLIGGLAMAVALSGAGSTESIGESLGFLMRPWSFPTPFDLALLVSCGILAAAGTVLLAQAYRVAQSATVAPYEYTAVIWALVYGLFFWGDWPDMVTWAGIAMIVLCGAITLLKDAGAWAGRRRFRVA